VRLADGRVHDLYTTLGGMRAVIWTDVIQFCTVSLGITLIFVTAVGSVDGGLRGVSNGAGRRTAGVLQPLHRSEGTDVAVGVPDRWNGSLHVAPHYGPGDLQRLFTTKSEQDCRRSIILQCLLIIPIGTLLYLAGVALYSFYKLNPSRIEGLSTRMR
jgi:Na+/proline symporter